jgi:hypothetical protein
MKYVLQTIAVSIAKNMFYNRWGEVGSRQISLL